MSKLQLIFSESWVVKLIFLQVVALFVTTYTHTGQERQRQLQYGGGGFPPPASLSGWAGACEIWGLPAGIWRLASLTSKELREHLSLKATGAVMCPELRSLLPTIQHAASIILDDFYPKNYFLKIEIFLQTWGFSQVCRKTYFACSQLHSLDLSIHRIGRIENWTY